MRLKAIGGGVGAGVGTGVGRGVRIGGTRMSPIASAVCVSFLFRVVDISLFGRVEGDVLVTVDITITNTMIGKTAKKAVIAIWRFTIFCVTTTKELCVPYSIHTKKRKNPEGRLHTVKTNHLDTGSVIKNQDSI